MKFLAPLLVGVAAVGLLSGTGHAMSLREAVNLTVYSNPEIGEAVFDRNAIGFELKQAKGEWLPRLDLEFRGGAEWADRSFTRQRDQYFYGPYELRATGRQKLFDGFATTYEIERQKARLDATSFRVWERAEFIGLSAVRAYVEVARLSEVEQSAQRNIAYHSKVASDMRVGLSRGVISVADVQQASERVYAARLALQEVAEELELAEATFIEIVGKPLSRLGSVPSIAQRIPGTLPGVLNVARRNNPLISLRKADIDAANAQIKIAESEYYPSLDLELSSSVGENLNGFPGVNNQATALVVMRWNIFNGNITKNKRAEQVERAGEARMRSARAYREVERETRASWIRRIELSKQLAIIKRQLSASRQLLVSYEGQFTVGQRTLLDVLDTQNTVFFTEVSEISARYAQRFANYRLLAAMGGLLESFEIQPPAQAEAGYRQVRDDEETEGWLPGKALPGVAAQWARGTPVAIPRAKE
ncbi:Outer membrane efflux protein BepC precursor [Pseudovibrio axinellae]|uniref:Outer membrane efflux protein BepC n=1 Tax=Pseudovibrio axinellae TaxID=989403 RepID=A0A165YRK2_9HYPH|nr:TolC family outer membrane protein [Pseudovibrio axinellae]KZL19154.1 Outer membrane efflux protein BepC precursor [Pseudovibrio axinellae]SER34909.1 outer membrane protein, adhesin transport system [Pseudovibrio axinellae]